jgi:hypothetical protein
MLRFALLFAAPVNNLNAAAAAEPAGATPVFVTSPGVINVFLIRAFALIFARTRAAAAGDNFFTGLLGLERLAAFELRETGTLFRSAISNPKPSTTY